MPVFINPLSDTGFKIIFGKEGVSEEFLRDFLNELFVNDPELNHIKTVTYRNVERTPNTPEGKTPRYDIHCETETGHRFIVEMQRQQKPRFLDRVEYYVARGITDQGDRALREGEWDYKLVPVVGVFIANFPIHGLERKLVTHTREMDVETLQPIGDKVRKAYIQLDTFDKKAEECLTGFDKWIYILKNMETMTDIPFKSMKDGVFNRLADVSRVSALSDEDRMRYEIDLKWARDYNAELQYARDTAAAEGRAEGRAQGRAEGRAQGRAEGIAEGRAEGIEEERKAVARKLKDMGMTTEQIKVATGLNDLEINKL